MTGALDPALVRAVDAGDMLGRALAIGEQLPSDRGRAMCERLRALAGPSPSHIVVGGLGGSAIGGDLLRGILGGGRASPLVTVVRDYSLPALEPEGTLVLLCSYSGETEETLSLYEEAAARGMRRAVIASGGALAGRALRDGVPLETVPEGFAPRAALGHLLSGLLASAAVALGRPDILDPLDEARAALRSLAARCSPDRAGNPALDLAREAHRKIVVTYAARDPLEGVALRWKTQWNENAKVFAYAAAAPEMNHNEIVGWDGLRDGPGPFLFVFLRDADESPRLAFRLDWSRDRLREAGGEVREFSGEGRTRLSRILWLVSLGDLASVYLALLKGVDPTPVTSIQRLKRSLKERETA
jgi:glucose/mannose-6-phosphate isomerase